MVIWQSRVMKKRHSFGKSKGTAAILPHFAVRYRDTQCTMEKVTKGYQVVLVYSLCLPKAMHHREIIHDVPLSATAITKMDTEDDSFALFLTHDYTDQNIESLGVGALNGVDSVRFHALVEANTFVSADHKLRFLMARLIYQAPPFDPRGILNRIRWFSGEPEDLAAPV